MIWGYPVPLIFGNTHFEITCNFVAKGRYLKHRRHLVSVMFNPPDPL